MRRRDDRGAATVDFVLVGTLVTLLFLAVLQVGVAFYVRSVLAASAAEGARYAANADVADPGAGAARANALIRQSLGSSFARATTDARPEVVDGVPMVRVDVTARLPLLAWFLPVGPTVHVTGHAVLEPR